MEIEEFFKARPYLYHLTFSTSLPLIKQHRQLLSANVIVEMAKSERAIMRQRRPSHVELDFNGEAYWLRDQRPLSERALSKCLPSDWTCPDYYFLLNDRVFLWPTLKRLKKHFNRYRDERPLIIRLNTREVISLNTNALFCRLNSGATRANSHLGGKPPSRGPETFLRCENYLYPPSSVAEVTFINKMDLPAEFEIATNPEGYWTMESLTS